MEPISVALILAGLAASSAAAVYTNRQNIKYAQEANDTSVALANTSHQREVRDLQAAGLNPILSASGSGASVPQLKVPNLSNPLGDAASSARDLASAVNGSLDASIREAKANATSAENTAGLIERENLFDSLTKKRQALEDAAFISAMDDDDAIRVYADPEIDEAFRYGNKTWQSLRNQFKREIATGEYKASMWRAVKDDVGDVVNSASSLMPVGRALKGLKYLKYLKGK